MFHARRAALLPLLSLTACAAEIVLPAPDMERDQAVTAIYRTSGLATGKGTLAVRWSDALGRVVEDRTIPVELSDENEIPFPLDMRRAVAMQNTLTANFTLEGVNRKGEPDRRDERAQVNFIARPPDRDWRDYRIIMWQDYPADQWKTLQSLGINAGQYIGRNSPPPDFLAGSDPLHETPEKLFQGPIADALTHIGQLAMLRRISGAPMKGENYHKAEIGSGQVGKDQPAPRREFD